MERHCHWLLFAVCLDKGFNSATMTACPRLITNSNFSSVTEGLFCIIRQTSMKAMREPSEWPHQRKMGVCESNQWGGIETLVRR